METSSLMELYLIQKELWKFKNHHFGLCPPPVPTPHEIVDLTNDHQWLMKLPDEQLKDNFMVDRCDHLISTHNLSINKNRTSTHHMPPDVIQEHPPLRQCSCQKKLP